MLSLKNFLNASEEERALRKVISLLLEKIGLDSVKFDSTEYAAFCAEMNHFRERAIHDSSPATLFITAGSAIQAMEIYNLRVAGVMRKQAAEVQCIVAMITDTAVKLGGENLRSAQRLQEIGNKFEGAGALEDLHALKAHLGDCLQSFREEVQRQKAESDATIRSLQREIERRSGGERAAVIGDNDPVTRLPRKAAGLQAMRAASEAGKQLYVAAIVVKGVQSVNSRFGFDIGDRMLCAFKENVEKQLSRQDQLFRWDGPAIVALMDRTEPIAQIRAQLRRILDAHLEETFDVDGRSVLIPITASWLAFSLVPPVALAVKQIQSFVAGQVPSVVPA